MGNFMYFPDNKLEYIPSLITLVIFIIITFIAFRFIQKISRKEEEKAKEIEKRITEHNMDQTPH